MITGEGLLASAGINIGLALILVSLFSIFKRQPSNAHIYYARRISLQEDYLYVNIPVVDRRHSLRRFLPSLQWIQDALKVTEDDILHNCGLDRLVLIRLFKFGIKLFVACSVLGLCVLLPLNYLSNKRSSDDPQSMDQFTISNISGGSDRLWVHYSCLCIITLYGVYLLHKEYKHIMVNRVQQQRLLRHQPNQFTVLVRNIPFCGEHKAYGCCVDHFFSKYHPYTYRSCQILYDGKDLEDLLNRAKKISDKIETLRLRSLTKKHVSGSSLSQAFNDNTEIEHLEGKLQELHRKIRETRGTKMLEEKEMPVAFITFRSRRGATLVAQSQQHSNPLFWTTEMAPEPRDILWRSLAISYKQLPLYKGVVLVAASLLTIFFAIPVTAVQGIAKFEKLKKWFPLAMAVQLIPGLRSTVTGYLPSVILTGCIYVVPFAMMGMAKLAGYVSRSRKDIKACNMVFYFLVGNVFFLSLLSGSLLDQIGKSFSQPKDFPSHLASAVSAQADFFMTYILTSGLTGFSLEILQPGLLVLNYIKLHTWGRGKNKNPYLYSLPYYRIIPFICLFILIGMVYAVVAPLLLPFLIGYFALGYVVFIHQIQEVYETTYETCGQYWPYIHHYIVIALVIMQITMIGLFGMKAKPSASFATIPLLIVTLLFNEYCKMRFLPTFDNYSVQDAAKNDELDEQNGLMEDNCRKALDAYCPPCLRPESVNEESTSTQPLIL
ncbi:Early-responsive to dehydration stress protein (ERD4) [Heracleum sosnowskyi]|uniref:Early-responsive to dehydration stress protein (ERD4) n=1 Tax=Heracleum sosnowskyi TaxID=360622 RepID=A0AAD8HPG8_9APIA|nr:Early-responsive to dehydration stress protein (ERD4) [Heracleum sosnowskyi]